MTWYQNDAATRQVRTFMGAYAKAQRAYEQAQPLDLWSGFTSEEWARWVATGEVSDRLIRVWFHGHELRYPGALVELWDTDRGQLMLTVPRSAEWREVMASMVRQRWPGFADGAQAYLETQTRR